MRDRVCRHRLHRTPMGNGFPSEIKGHAGGPALANAVSEAFGLPAGTPPKARGTNKQIHRRRMNRLTVAVACVLAAGAAFAGPLTVPEPGVLELLAIGGVMAAVIAFRNRRK